MKHTYIPLLIVTVLSLHFISAQDLQEIPKVILKNTTLTKNTTYMADEYITVSQGATLIIEEGVTLNSKNHNKIVFIIDNGSKIIAKGSADYPIKTMQENEKPLPIIMTNSMTKDNKIVGSQFSYKNIDYPTMVVNTNPYTHTDIGNVDHKH